MATWAHKGIIVTLENSGPRKKGPQYYRVTWFDPKVGERTCEGIGPQLSPGSRV